MKRPNTPTAKLLRTFPRKVRYEIFDRWKKNIQLFAYRRSITPYLPVGVFVRQVPRDSRSSFQRRNNNPWCQRWRCPDGAAAIKHEHRAELNVFLLPPVPRQRTERTDIESCHLRMSMRRKALPKERPSVPLSLSQGLIYLRNVSIPCRVYGMALGKLNRDVFEDSD